MARLIDADALMKYIRNHDYQLVSRMGCVDKGMFTDGIEHGINIQPTVERWIPVTERLPERGQQVIVYSGGVLSPSVFAYHFWNNDFASWAHITHWMPLPEPPKEVE